MKVFKWFFKAKNTEIMYNFLKGSRNETWLKMGKVNLKKKKKNLVSKSDLISIFC